ncbi:MFS transporter [Aliiglaciecola sp. CAU 1673]|uniref:MFS transporter n=1 Tax=Aliiglaciecola sp. CAU 1673 TaxID=3032595 RepID=UPI0023DCCC33|nr:MFS transporter [Aliiglaciecola sp. CAU 1673]MDF2179034.1 MFS transporter [Aliiglaciecola sp. CAU 1673]
MGKTKPELSFWQIWNMCFGFMGIQFGFALQNANVSRIFQTLGADYNNMAMLWVAAPITGLIVQPIIGYLSDNTWGKLGRRRPYFLYGAIAASLALFIMPNSPALWVAAGMLWIMDASINVSMEPFRAFVGDMLPRRQRALGYAMQSFFIGVGAVVASALPWMMTNWMGVSNTAAPGQVPESVKLAFYAGGAVFLLAVLWTVFSTKEYSPEQLDAFEDSHPAEGAQAEMKVIRSTGQYVKGGLAWLVSGVVIGIVIHWNIERLDKNLYLLAGGLMAFGVAQLIAGYMASKRHTANGFYQVIGDLFNMPLAMRQLAVVQFFSWFPLFAMWIYTTAAVTSHHYNTQDTSSVLYNQGADWVGVLFSVYNGTSILAAILIPIMVKFSNLRITHLFNLALGGVGFISFLYIDDPAYLVIPMIGVGFAWASILSVPYAILSNALPAAKMGVYMGIFNFFIVIPQILAASILGFLVTRLFDSQPVFALVVGGCSMLLAGLMTLRVNISEA